MSRHLKRCAAPKSWVIKRKVHKWILKPLPGAHPIEKMIPIGLLMRQLECGQTSKEIKKILNDKNATVNGKTIKKIHHGVGFLDAISIKPNTYLRGTIDSKGRLKFIDAPQEEMNKILCKITGKKTVKEGKTQYNLSNGRNILAEKDKYTTGDSLLIEVPSQKIIEHFPMTKGNTALLTGGRHIGTVGKIENIEGNRAWCTKDKEKVETLKKYVFTVGKDKPAFKL